MSVTQEQHQQVLLQIADLRVHVETLAGKMDVTNERVNNTNLNLSELVKTLNEQAEQTKLNRKWVIGTFLGTVATAISIITIILRFLM